MDEDDDESDTSPFEYYSHDDKILSYLSWSTPNTIADYLLTLKQDIIDNTLVDKSQNLCLKWRRVMKTLNKYAESDLSTAILSWAEDNLTSDIAHDGKCATLVRRGHVETEATTVQNTAMKKRFDEWMKENKNGNGMIILRKKKQHDGTMTTYDGFVRNLKTFVDTLTDKDKYEVFGMRKPTFEYYFKKKYPSYTAETIYPGSKSPIEGDFRSEYGALLIKISKKQKTIDTFFSKG